MPPLPTVDMKRFSKSLALSLPTADFISAVEHLLELSAAKEITPIAKDAAFQYLLIGLSNRLKICEMDKNPQLFTIAFDECKSQSSTGNIYECAIKYSSGTFEYHECISRLALHVRAKTERGMDPKADSATRLIIHTLLATSGLLRLDEAKIAKIGNQCRSNATMEYLL